MHGITIAVIVQFSRPSYTVGEMAAMVNVAVQISSASETVRVNVGTMDTTASGRYLL